MAYSKENQKKYSEKIKKYTIKYTLHEMDIAAAIDNAILDSGLTANAWIKLAIAEKLDREKR